MPDVMSVVKLAKEASINLLKIDSRIKDTALSVIADNIEKNSDKILTANQSDIQKAKELLNEGLINESVFNRLKLDENKLRDMIQGVKDIIKLKDPVNNIIWQKNIAKGIKLKKISCPIGVIAVIFEARPDVITQISALAIKSSNVVILKGGAEASQTNQAIFDIISNSLSQIKDFPKDSINILFSRDDVKTLLEADEYVDLIIPRGSNSLVKYIKTNTKIPVLGHSEGICHIYVDKFADKNKAINIIIDSKCQYPSACNSVETVLVHSSLKNTILKDILYALKSAGVKINSDDEIKNLYPDMIDDTVSNWKNEYGDKIISIKTVNSLEEAINHINKYGSRHTDSIITENDKNAEKFMLYVDSAGVYKNISTRFADGYRYGFGAEVGISTNKIHARGPVGLDGLTTYKYKLYGSGDIVKDFIEGKRDFIK